MLIDVINPIWLVEKLLEEFLSLKKCRSRDCLRTGRRRRRGRKRKRRWWLQVIKACH
jgi:hypothetical protein